MSTDPRDPVYDDLHGGQLSRQEARNRDSARTILGIVFRHASPRSVLDVGCGLGTWLSVAQGLGVSDVVGVEGQWLDVSRLRVEPELVTACDLEQGFSLGRRFDLAVCLEVAEHLSEPAGERLVASLCNHGDLVLFSAAIPYQGGHHHINEQFPSYWQSRFATHGFRPIDLVRPHVWDDPGVLWWLRQNTLLFAHERAVAANDSLRREAAIPRPLSLVHPDVYLSRVRQAAGAREEHAGLVALLAQEGTFEVKKSPDGRLAIRRLTPPC